MSEHLDDTISHLRKIISELQNKLDSRSLLLSQIIPHIESANNDFNSNGNESLNISYIAHEYCERYASLIKQFKDEYGKENPLQQSKDSKL